VVVDKYEFDMKMNCTVIGDSVNILFGQEGLTRSFPNDILISKTHQKLIAHTLQPE